MYQFQQNEQKKQENFEKLNLFENVFSLFSFCSDSDRSRMWIFLFEATIWALLTHQTGFVLLVDKFDTTEKG
jgi:hypothetical protein